VRVFLDTSVLVAAFATRGVCADLLRVVLAEHDPLVSEHVLRELRRVLAAKLGLPASRIREIEVFLRSEAEVVDPQQAAAWPQSDPADRWIVAGALAGRADVLVTGDHDILDIADQLPFRTTNPRGFWELIKA
jgi:putative PIN family toxin of toxin-antitoxin system